MADKTLQAKLDRILSAQGQQTLRTTVAFSAHLAKPLFSAFVDRHVWLATELAQQLMAIADESGLDAAIEAIFTAQKTESLAGLVQYATQLFLTHHPEARDQIKFKPLEIRQPELVRPSRTLTQKITDLVVPASGFMPARSIGGATEPEDRLEFWREDPLLNEHHEHWHLVYPTAPLPSVAGAKPPAGYKLGDRHGELFAYMHEQMIARYDAERLAVGLPRVTPFDLHPLTDLQFTAPIPEGYDPGQLRLWDGARAHLAVVGGVNLPD